MPLLFIKRSKVGVALIFFEKERERSGTLKKWERLTHCSEFLKEMGKLFNGEVIQGRILIKEYMVHSIQKIIIHHACYIFIIIFTTGNEETWSNSILLNQHTPNYGFLCLLKSNIRNHNSSFGQRKNTRGFLWWRSLPYCNGRINFR